MPRFQVTGFPANYEPPEDESIVLPPGAGRRVKGVPFGVTEDTAAVLRTLAYLEEIVDDTAEPPSTPVTDDSPAALQAAVTSAPPVDSPGLTELGANAPDPQAEETPEPVPSGRARKSKE